ncbi:MAG: cellulase family glycosylhydrolase [Rikenellaceae bacterium]
MRRIYNLFIFLLAAVVMSCGDNSQSFISVSDGQFVKSGEPYYFIGTNFWYGAILGSQGEGGCRERLSRELDFLKSIGVENLRVAVGGEGTNEYKSKISPILQPNPGEYDDELLDGLDYFMSELRKRDMTAVLYLANAWEWSGGFIQYLQWAGEVEEDFDIENASWTDYRATATKFVRSDKAKALLNDHIKFIVSRTNRYTGEKYIDDPAIFSWQLCNEPRAFSAESKEYLYKWVDETSTLIRSIDPNHLISTGSEGRMGCEGDIELFTKIHALPNISYLNAHMWSYNWGWIDRTDMAGSIDGTIQKCKDYLAEHIAVAESLGKPLVVEEFGLPRDDYQIKRGSTTTCRDRLYKTLFDAILKSSKEEGVFAGCNFWSWGGEAAQIEGQEFWQRGMDYAGDPPQEAQGLNSVYIDDTTTLEIIKKYITLTDE